MFHICSSHGWKQPFFQVSEYHACKRLLYSTVGNSNEKVKIASLSSNNSWKGFRIWGFNKSWSKLGVGCFPSSPLLCLSRHPRLFLSQNTPAGQHHCEIVNRQEIMMLMILGCFKKTFKKSSLEHPRYWWWTKITMTIIANQPWLSWLYFPPPDGQSVQHLT